jgi:hypothetical protein
VTNVGHARPGHRADYRVGIGIEDLDATLGIDLLAGDAQTLVSYHRYLTGDSSQFSSHSQVLR